MHEAYGDFIRPGLAFYDSQMVPPGHPVRLRQIRADEVHWESIPKRLSVVWDRRLSSSEFPRYLADCAKRRGITLEVEYQTGQVSRALHDRFAVMGNFVSNQKDALSSWQFLYRGNGYLKAYADEVDEALLKASRGEGEAMYWLREIHRRALERYHMVPFLSEYHSFLKSRRIN